jgi:uncharacterized membrane protein (DUF106 family)
MNPLIILIVIIIVLFCYLQIKKGTLINQTKQSSLPKKLTIEQGKPVLKKRLLQLVYSDKETANRLLHNVVKKYPHKTVNWYFEKVIHDLEQDRR